MIPGTPPNFAPLNFAPEVIVSFPNRGAHIFNHTRGNRSLSSGRYHSRLYFCVALRGECLQGVNAFVPIFPIRPESLPVELCAVADLYPLPETPPNFPICWNFNKTPFYCSYLFLFAKRPLFSNKNAPEGWNSNKTRPLFPCSYLIRGNSFFSYFSLFSFFSFFLFFKKKKKK